MMQKIEYLIAVVCIYFARRAKFPPDAIQCVLGFFKRFTWQDEFRRTYYDLVLRQGRPSVFQPLLDQFVSTPVSHDSFQTIIDFLV